MIYFICLASPMQRKIPIRDSYKDKRSRVSLPIFCLNFDIYIELSKLISIDRAKSVYLYITPAQHMVYSHLNCNAPRAR